VVAAAVVAAFSACRPKRPQRSIWQLYASIMV
jgi:hypothetical protein